MHEINHINVEKKNQVKVNDESTGGYTTGNDIKFKTIMLR